MKALKTLNSFSWGIRGDSLFPILSLNIPQAQTAGSAGKTVRTLQMKGNYETVSGNCTIPISMQHHHPCGARQRAKESLLSPQLRLGWESILSRNRAWNFTEVLKFFQQERQPQRNFPPEPGSSFSAAFWAALWFFLDLCKCRTRTREIKGPLPRFSNWLCRQRPWWDIPGTYLCVRPEHSSTGRAERWVRTESRSGPPWRVWSSRWGAVIPWEPSGIPLHPNSGKRRDFLYLSRKGEFFLAWETLTAPPPRANLQLWARAARGHTLLDALTSRRGRPDAPAAAQVHAHCCCCLHFWLSAHLKARTNSLEAVLHFYLCCPDYYLYQV